MGLCAARRTRRARQGLTLRRCRSGLVDEVKARAPKLRGRLAADAPIAEATWFRVGGPAEALFSPADEDDLAYVLSALPREIPVTTIGLGSNLIVRDGGVAGLVIRLGGRAFGAVEIMEGSRVVVGAAAPDQYVAKAAANSGRRWLGVPARRAGFDRRGFGHERRRAWRRDQGRRLSKRGARPDGRASALFRMRRWAFPTAIAWRRTTSCSPARRFRAAPASPTAIEAEMERITRAREASQPIREKTGGSTFKNPPGMKAWELIDKAGCRGLRLGGAQVSTMHCNFLINLGVRDRRRSRSAWRGGQAPGSRDERGCARMGDQAHRRRAWTGIKVLRVTILAQSRDSMPILCRTRRRLGERHAEQKRQGSKRRS